MADEENQKVSVAVAIPAPAVTEASAPPNDGELVQDNLKGLILDGPPQAGEDGHGHVVEGGGNDFSYMAEDRTWCGCALDDLDESFSEFVLCLELKYFKEPERDDFPDEEEWEEAMDEWGQRDYIFKQLRKQFLDVRGEPVFSQSSATEEASASVSYDNYSDSGGYVESESFDETKMPHLKRIGALQMKKVLSLDGKTEYVLLNAPESVYEFFAEQFHLPIVSTRRVKPDHYAIFNFCASAGADAGYLRKYREFDIAHRNLFPNHHEKNEFNVTSKFTSAEKIALLTRMIQLPRIRGGLGVILDQVPFIKWWPVHCPVELDNLKRKWFSFFSPQPLDHIQEYFGPRIAFYFAFLGFYTQFLFFAAIPGAVVQIIISVGDYDNLLVPIYAIFAMLWVTIFLEFDKRNQATLAYRWNMTNLEEQEVVRHEYRGQKRIGGFRRGVYFPLGDLHNRFKSKGKDLAANNLQLKQTVVYDSSPFYHRWVMGGVVIVSFIAVVVSVTISLLVLRVTLRDVNPTYGGIAGGTIISVVIAIMNFVYGKVAVLLTNWENHRTESQYSGALITKMFVFQFVNSYSSLFYVAFMVNTDILSSFFPDSPRQTCVEEQIGSGSDSSDFRENCVLDLGQQLLSIMITSQVIGQVKELLIPFVIGKVKKFTDISSAKRAQESASASTQSVDENAPEQTFQLNRIELEANLGVPKFDYTFAQFNELSVQFGYVSLFISSFPLAAFAALVNNVVEIRGDAWILTTQTRRPIPHPARDIGAWKHVLQALGLIAVVTNSGILAFTSNTFEFNFGWNDNFSRLAAALILEHAMFTLKFVIARFIHDVPGPIRMRVARQDFLRGGRESAHYWTHIFDEANAVREAKIEAAGIRLGAAAGDGQV